MTPSGDVPMDADDVDGLRELLLRVRQAEDERLRRDWNRSLPFGDALFDRWERARGLGFGDGASIYDSALVYGEVQAGEQTWIGPYTLLDGSGGGIEIGSYCSISAGVHIYTHDTVMWALSGGRADRRTAATRIGDRCHVGAQSIVAAGVELGTQCVVAANSFVNRSFPGATIVGGHPPSYSAVCALTATTSCSTTPRRPTGPSGPDEAFMCGITGIVCADRRPASPVIVRRMTDALEHRGPDGEGYCVHESVAFGHRRLAIIDLSAGAATSRWPPPTASSR